jgi:hypothetical protein
MHSVQNAVGYSYCKLLAVSPHSGWECRACRPTCAINELRNRGDCGVLEEDMQRDIETEDATQPGNYAHCQQRMAAELKKIIISANFLNI